MGLIHKSENGYNLQYNHFNSFEIIGNYALCSYVMIRMW